MNEHRKKAYRHLLFWAMLDIRGMEFIHYRPWRLLNPFTLRRELRRVARAGAVANLMHNLASDSENDFAGFREEQFWTYYEDFVRRYGDNWNYRACFERRVAELQTTESKQKMPTQESS